MTTGGGECSQAWEKTAEPHNETTSWDRKRARVRRIYTTTSNYAAHGIITLCVLLYQKKKGKVKLCRRQKSVGSEGAANPINHTTKTMRRKNREENSKKLLQNEKKRRREVRDQWKEELSEHKQHKPEQDMLSSSV